MARRWPITLLQVLHDPHAPRTAAADVYGFSIVLIEIMLVSGLEQECHEWPWLRACFTHEVHEFFMPGYAVLVLRPWLRHSVVQAMQRLCFAFCEGHLV
jgi:hypothetical protein